MNTLKGLFAGVQLFTQSVFEQLPLPVEKALKEIAPYGWKVDATVYYYENILINKCKKHAIEPATAIKLFKATVDEYEPYITQELRKNGLEYHKLLKNWVDETDKGKRTEKYSIAHKNFDQDVMPEYTKFRDKPEVVLVRIKNYRKILNDFQYIEPLESDNKTWYKEYVAGTLINTIVRDLNTIKGASERVNYKEIMKELEDLKERFEKLKAL